MNITIRKATIDDSKAILDIYGPYILNTAITFEYVIPTLDEFKDRVKHILDNYPYYVALDNDKIIGYTYAHRFRERKAFDHTVELSLYLNPNYKGLGLGKRLYNVLFDDLKAMGIKSMIATVATTPDSNDPYLTNGSIIFHEKMGFSKCGTLNKCGYKFDRFYNLTYYEKLI